MVARPLRFKDFVPVDYSQTGDDQLALNSKKRKRDSGETTTESPDEALNFAQRRARARSLRKNKAKIAMGRKKAAKRMANMDTLKKRARKAARKLIMKKLSKGQGKEKLSFARRQELEKKVDKMGARIDKLAVKLLPKVRKAEIARKRGGGAPKGGAK